MRNILCAVFTLAAGLCAQTPAPLPAFEVASVRPNVSGEHRSSSRVSNGELITQNVSLKQLIERAYNVKDYSLNGPDWLDGVRFDIVAKPPAGAPKEQFQFMLQSLLVDRFKLKAHREPKTLSAYALLLAKGGPKLKPTAEENGKSSMDTVNNQLTASGASMAKMADFLANRLQEPVVDKTDLPGAFDFSFTWTPDAEHRATDSKDSGPSIFTALQDQLGLRLQREKLPVEILVIDHVEKEPSEN